MAITLTIADGLSQDELTAGFTIPVTVTDVTADSVVSFTVDVLYDPAVIDITGATATDVTAGESLTVNTDFGGTGDTIRVVWASASALSGSGTLFELDVDAVGAIGNSTLVLETAEFNEGGVTVTSEDGDIDIISRTPAYAYSGVDATGSSTASVTGTGTTPSYSYTEVDGVGSVALRIYEDHSGKTTSTEDPDWSFLRNPSTGSTQTIVADGTARGGKHLRLESTDAGTDRYILTLDRFTQDDGSIVIRFRQGDVSANQETAFYVRASGSEGNENGYFVALTNDTGVNVWEYNSGSLTAKLTGTTFTRVVDTWYMMRLYAVGSEIKFRLWADGTDEIDTWQAEITDATHTTGSFGISMQAAGAGKQVDLDFFGAGLEGIAGLEIEEEDLPNPGAIVSLQDDDSIRIIDITTGDIYLIAIIQMAVTNSLNQVSLDTDTDELYVASSGDSSIWKMTRLGYDTTLFLDGVAPIGLGVDNVNGYLYYQEFSAGDLRRVDLADGTNDTLIRSDAGVGTLLNYSVLEDKVYFAADNGVHRIDPDGSNYELLETLTNAASIISDGTYYWYTNFTTSTGIVEREDNDNSNQITLWSDGSDGQDITLDTFNEKVYVCEGTGNNVYESDYDGSNRSVLVSGFSVKGIDYFDTVSVIQPSSTPSYLYSGVDASSVFGNITEISDTPEVSYDGVDGTFAGGPSTAEGGTAAYAYVPVNGDSNIVSGFHDNLGSYSYAGVDAFGILTDTALTFQYPNIHEEYTEFTVNVLTTDITGDNVTGFQCEISYDPTIIIPTQILPVGLTSGESITANISTPGTILVAWAGVSALSGSGTLFQIEFHGEDITDPSEVSPLTWVSFLWNEGTPSDTTTDGEVRVVSNAGVTPSYTYTVVSPTELISTTASFTYDGVDGHPVLAMGGISFGIPPDPIVYESIDATSIPAAISHLGTSSSYVYSGVGATAGTTDTIGIVTSVGLYRYIAQDASELTTVLGVTPSYTYSVPQASETTFGTPRRIKLETFNAYSTKVNIVPKVFDGVNNIGETLLVQAVVRDSSNQLETLSQSLFVFILNTNGDVTGPFEMTATETGHYEYEYVAEIAGVYWARIQDPLSDVIEEKRFVARSSKVIV